MTLFAILEGLILGYLHDGLVGRNFEALFSRKREGRRLGEDGDAVAIS